jgi:hypothetical protein
LIKRYEITEQKRREGEVEEKEEDEKGGKKKGLR